MSAPVESADPAEPPAPADPARIARLAAEHGLAVDPSSLRFNEMGLDFRVAIARAEDDRQWVLRVPRRPAVMEQARVEGSLLAAVSGHLHIEMPDWRIHSERLIAYPLLSGTPGLELGEDGAPRWHVEVSAPAFAESLGGLLGELHAVPAELVAPSGIPIRAPEQCRQAWSDDIDRVAGQFRVAGDLLASWRRWLDDDGLWPDHSVLCHGEIYPGHTLVDDDGRIIGVLDWTTASVGDPAQDLMFHRATATAEAFELTLTRYRERGGRTWPRLGEHCAAMLSAAPVRYGLYALETGEQQHRGAAQAQLDPTP